MFSTRRLLQGICLLCAGFIIVALYLQHYHDVVPCPLCVLQRYFFLGVGLCCFLGVFFSLNRLGAFAGACLSIGGAATAAYQLWTMKHASIRCDLKDPLGQMVNSWLPAQWLPSLFRAEGNCSESLTPIFWLTPPQWSLLWFCIFILVLLWMAYRKG